MPGPLGRPTCNGVCDARGAISRLHVLLRNASVFTARWSSLGVRSNAAIDRSIVWTALPPDFVPVRPRGNCNERPGTAVLAVVIDWMPAQFIQHELHMKYSENGLSKLVPAQIELFTVRSSFHSMSAVILSALSPHSRTSKLFSDQTPFEQRSRSASQFRPFVTCHSQSFSWSAGPFVFF